MSEVTAAQLEKQIQDNKTLIERRDRALKLYQNPDFKKVVLEDFCTSECARYAQSSADPALNAEQRADALAIAQAAGHLRRYLSVVVQMGNHAENQIPSLEEAVIEARAEAGE